MIIYRFNDRGQYTLRVHVNQAGLAHEDQARIYAGEVDMVNQYHDLESNRPRNKPPQPSIHHEFDYVTKLWILNAEDAWRAVRRRRDELLSSTDWMVTRFMETAQPIAEGWSEYRQALRDIMLQTDPTNIVWPQPPG